MPGKEPFYSKSTFGYFVVGLGIALVSSVFFTPLGNLVGRRLMERSAPEQRLASSNLPPTTTSELNPSLSGAVNAQPLSSTQASQATSGHVRVEAPLGDPQSASLSLDYDALKERFSAVNQSILLRATDLGGLPLKPEIAAALRTVNADLAATELALQNREWDVAKQRMDRVKKTLNYLESL